MDGADKMQLVLQTLGEANRLRIIKYIGEEERSVSEIVQNIKLSQPLVSHHLRILRENVIVATDRKGPFIYYRLKNTRLLEALAILSDVFREIDPVRHKIPMFCCPPEWYMHGYMRNRPRKETKI